MESVINCINYHKWIWNNRSALLALEGLLFLYTFYIHIIFIHSIFLLLLIFTPFPTHDPKNANLTQKSFTHLIIKTKYAAKSSRD